MAISLSLPNTLLNSLSPSRTNNLLTFMRIYILDGHIYDEVSGVCVCVCGRMSVNISEIREREREESRCFVQFQDLCETYFLSLYLNV